MQFWPWVNDRRGRLGENIVDCHTVQGSFSKAFRESWAQSKLEKESPCFPGTRLLWYPCHRWSLAGSSLQEACPQCRCSHGMCPPSLSPLGSPWAQQSKLPCLSPGPSQSRGQRTTTHLSAATPEQRRQATSGKQEAAETQASLQRHLGQPFDQRSRPWFSRLSGTSPGWKKKAVCWVDRISF